MDISENNSKIYVSFNIFKTNNVLYIFNQGLESHQKEPVLELESFENLGTETLSKPLFYFCRNQNRNRYY